MEGGGEITSNPKLFCSAPILSLHCTLTSISTPALGLREVPGVAAVWTMAKAMLQAESDRNGEKATAEPFLQ